MLMIICIGLSGLAFFHLLTHALFKDLLFICAGVVIHSIGDSQDISFIGGLSVCMTFTSSSLMVSNFTVRGMPFFGCILFQSCYVRYVISLRYVNMSCS
jgi:NADH-ubiquinone oxidoreductase chain 5